MSPDFLSSLFSAGVGASVATPRVSRGVEAIHDRCAVDAERLHARSIDIVCSWRFGFDNSAAAAASPHSYLHMYYSSCDGFPARLMWGDHSRSTFVNYLRFAHLYSHILFPFFPVPSAVFYLPRNPAANLSKWHLQRTSTWS